MYLKASIEIWRKERTTSGRGCALECRTASPSERRGAVWAASADCRITAGWRASKELFEDLWLVLFPAAERSWPDERDWSSGFDLMACRLSVSGNFFFSLFSNVLWNWPEKTPTTFKKIKSNNKPTMISQPVRSWDPWGEVVCQSWSRTAKAAVPRAIAVAL